MSKDHSNTGTFRGVGYWRMSSSPQEKSIPQQRSEMLPRCRLERVDLVAEFADEAKSGGSMIARDAFLDLVLFCKQQAQAGTPLGCVVCYDTSRFSRASSIKTARYIDELMDAGVYRLLTWERWYDFRREEDRAIFLLQQDFTNNRFLRDLSARVLRGRKDAVGRGLFAGGTVPYGFDRLLVDAQGNPQGTFRRGEKFARPRGWHVVLVPIPADDPDPARQLERQTVLWLYETFVRQRVSYRSLAFELNRRGVPGPGTSYRVRDEAGKLVVRTRPTKWLLRVVAEILRNPVYRGTYRFGHTGAGHYHRLQDGQVVAVDPGAGKTTGADGCLRAPLEHGGLVPEELWEAAQALVQERARLGLRPRHSNYVLPGGLLYCGHCGHRMYGCTMTPRRGAKRYTYKKYVCSAPNVRPGVCKCYSVNEGVLVAGLVKILKERYVNDEALAAMEAELLARAQARRDGAPALTLRLKARLEQLERDIVRGRRRVLQAADDVTYEELNQGLRELVEQRRRLEKELATCQAHRQEPAAGGEDLIQAAVARLRELGRLLDTAQGKELGEVLRALILRADLYFQERHNGKRLVYDFVRAEVRPRPALDVKAYGRSGSSSAPKLLTHPDDLVLQPPPATEPPAA
jgi:DNA invertase Pin-like site-specific DNA recombinase